MTADSRHETVVVGGGIAGLAAGAALAAAGRPVIILEKGPALGGCCSSFSRGGFTFSTGTSVLSGLGPGGRLRGVLDRCGVDLPLARPSFRETVLTPRFTLPLPSDPVALEEELQARFPGDGGALGRFFGLLRRPGPGPGPAVATGADLLASLGLSDDTRFLLEAFLGNLGLPASRVDGATALAFFREFLLDGGWCPPGGAHRLAEALANRVRESGGEVRTGATVNALESEGTRVTGVRLADGSRVGGDSFILAAEPGLACLPADGTDPARERFRRVLEGPSPSVSAFLVFLGLRGRLDDLTAHPGHLLHLPEGSMDSIHRGLDDDDRLLSPEGYVYIIAPSRDDPSLAPPGCESVCLFVMAPRRDDRFWEAHRARMTDALVSRAERLLPGLSARIAVADSATPTTLERWTGNRGGALYGWESVPGRAGAGRLSPVTPWDNLVLAGHWTRPGSGVSSAAVSGLLAARMTAGRQREETRVPGR